jgi:hypothetical protein
MGWKLTAILIDGLYNGPAIEMLDKLGLGKRTEGQKVTVENALLPSGLFAGTFKNTTLLFNEDLVNAVFNEGAEDFIENLLTLFPQSRIAVVMLHSGINLYGLIYYEGGKRLRRLLGDSMDEIAFDEGEPLPAEVRAMAGYTESTDEDGEKVYVDVDGEELAHFDVGHERVFELMADFLGTNLDSYDDRAKTILYETEVTEFG